MALPGAWSFALLGLGMWLWARAARSALFRKSQAYRGELSHSKPWPREEKSPAASLFFPCPAVVCHTSSVSCCHDRFPLYSMWQDFCSSSGLVEHYGWFVGVMVCNIVSCSVSPSWSWRQEMPFSFAVSVLLLLASLISANSQHYRGIT